MDVLSFTTAVSVAVQSGTRVFPSRYGDAAATAYAAQHGAKPAVGRRAVTDASPWSLSPAHLRGAPSVSRLVLPSPNGAAIAPPPRPDCWWSLPACATPRQSAAGSPSTARAHVGHPLVRHS
ncbi:hypothetical protein ACFS5L_05960 [Streptomyces phyllanthi]|uniref:Uncharacterized protein n=1 Tax=Streptomyces phyllanthi TaxID=1803180 RepID=A0A5N8W8E6_9ACTN|nr:hypothetical protein [Streptomyces phyllanthi]MPY43392.1 hypothetical protein [Streptomyces phyllanthi]